MIVKEFKDNFKEEWNNLELRFGYEELNKVLIEPKIKNIYSTQNLVKEDKTPYNIVYIELKRR